MKRTPSNRMPKYAPSSLGPLGNVLVAVYIGMMVWLLCLGPWQLWVLVLGAVGVWELCEARRMSRIVDERIGESICNFARSFDYRSIDTWVIRAVYEEGKLHAGFPLRQTDNFDRDLHMNGDELDELAEEVAQRTGRPLTNCEQNPWYGKVETVGDMVEFFMCQPQQAPAACA